MVKIPWVQIFLTDCYIRINMKKDSWYVVRLSYLFKLDGKVVNLLARQFVT